MIEIEAGTDVAVVFARTPLDARGAGLAEPAVVITPDPTNWNDYGWKVFARVWILVGEELVGPEHIRLMIQGEVVTADALERLFERAGPVVPVELSGLNILSLLPTPARYAELLGMLGFDRTVLALRKLGDAALARLESPNDAQAEMLTSDAFWHGMLRADDAFGALQRGLRILQRTPADVVEDAAESFTVQARLPVGPEPYRVSFNFEPDTFGRHRAGVLIGRNGVGKTQLLRLIVEAFRAGADSELLWIEPRRTPSRVLVFSSVTSDPYERAIPPWEGVDYEYFSMTAPAQRGADTTLQALVSVRRDRQNRIGEA